MDKERLPPVKKAGAPENKNILGKGGKK